MSLATTGGGGFAGGAAGGIAMAHSAGAGSAAIAHAPPPAAQTGYTSSSAPASVLSANLLDKEQGISLKRVKNTAHLPIVAVDLYASTQTQVAYFPKKPEDPSQGTLPILVTENKKTKNKKTNDSTTTDLHFVTGEASHKTLRKFLSKKTDFATLQQDSLQNNTSTTKQVIISLPQPHRWLGYHRVADVPDALKSTLPDPISLANDDADENEKRILFRLQLAASKKPISLFPEEAMEIVLAQAQYRVEQGLPDAARKEIEDDAMFPFALAMPAYASSDATMEALRESMPSAVIVQRNVALLAGAMVEGDTVVQRIQTVRQALQAQYRKAVATDPEAVLEDTCMMIVASSTSGGGVECTAIQVFSPNPANVACRMGEYRVISNVSYPAASSVELSQCMTELETILAQDHEDLDGPTGIVFCSEDATSKPQLPKDWTKVPVFAMPPSAVAKGAAILGAVAHGRLSRILQSEGAKSRAVLGIHVQTVAPMAVAIQTKYSDGKDAMTDWSQAEPPKVLFDFDRPTPAGPYTIDYEAAETVVYAAQSNKKDLEGEEFTKAVAQHQGHKGIPAREAAALQLTVRILQQHTRNGEWRVVGEPWKPLTKKEDDKLIAIERVQVLITLSVTGLIATQHVGDGYVLVVLSCFTPLTSANILANLS